MEVDGAVVGISSKSLGRIWPKEATTIRSGFIARDLVHKIAVLAFLGLHHVDVILLSPFFGRAGLG